MVSTPGDAMSVSQVVKTVRVWSCLEDTDGRFLPNSMGREETTDAGLGAAEASGNCAWKPIAQTGRLSRGCSGNTIDPEYCAAVQNLPPHRWYQVVRESCDVGVFPGNFRLLLAEPTWWESQHARNVNSSSIKHAFKTDRRVCGNKKMADHKVKPPSANNAGHSSSRFHKKQGEIISEIHEALDNQAASSTLNQEQPKSEVRRRHNPSEE
jgi:hypothetical protein